MSQPALHAGMTRRSTLVHCSCFRQGLLAAYPGDCLLSIGCRTDHGHDWQDQ